MLLLLLTGCIFQFGSPPEDDSQWDTGHKEDPARPDRPEPDPDTNPVDTMDTMDTASTDRDPQCELYASEVQSLFDTPCELDTECEVVMGLCSFGLGGCYDALPSTKVDQLWFNVGAFSALECPESVCDCAWLETNAVCNDSHRCEVLFVSSDSGTPDP